MKIMKTFAITVIAIGSIFTFSQTTEAATLSIEEAAEKIYNAETKAYNTKKDVSVTVQVASKSSKKAIRGTTEKLTDALIKEELGDVDLTYVVRDKYIRPSIGGIIKRVGTCKSSNKKLKTQYFYFPRHIGASQTASYKNGALTIKFDIKGSKKLYRDQYYENSCLAKCVEELRGLTDGMSEKDKTWTVGMWVQDHFWYEGAHADGSRTNFSRIWKREGACGVCEQEAIANQLFTCLMGLDAAYVCDNEGWTGGHAWNCVKIDGEVYYWDGTDSLDGDWERIIRNEANEYSLSVSSIAGVKEWVDGTTVGEWCLLTVDEWTQVFVNASGDWEPERWGYAYKLGKKFPDYLDHSFDNLK